MGQGGRGLWKMLHWYDIAANRNKIKTYLIFTLSCLLQVFLFSHSFPCDYVDDYDIDFLVCTLRKMSGSSGIIVHRTMWTVKSNKSIQFIYTAGSISSNERKQIVEFVLTGLN